MGQYKSKDSSWAASLKRLIHIPQKTLCIGVIACLSLATGCSNAGKGGVAGGLFGAAVGAGIGAAAGGGKSAAIGAITGAAVGGTTGALIGRHMDRQAEQLGRDLKDARIERVGEGILITFEDGILFNVDEASLRASAKANIQQLADTLNRYDDTKILIVGHTDSTGEASYNHDLSLQRAQQVAQYAVQAGVPQQRIETLGEGEKEPVASNESAEGRQQNRRVEVAIYASEDLKERLASRAGS